MKKISKFKLGQKHPVWKKSFFSVCLFTIILPSSCSADIVECQIFLKKRTAVFRYSALSQLCHWSRGRGKSILNM